MRIYHTSLVRALTRLLQSADVQEFGLVDDQRGGLIVVDMTGCLAGSPSSGAGRVWNVSSTGRIRRVTSGELMTATDTASAWCPRERFRRGEVVH